MMKLFLISQDENEDYDTYDSAVVAAPDAETAMNMHPRNGAMVCDWDKNYNSWCSKPENVTVKYIGEANDGINQGVICASFNAG